MKEAPDEGHWILTLWKRYKEIYGEPANDQKQVKTQNINIATATLSSGGTKQKEQQGDTTQK